MLILGSTGSIGTQALEIVRNFRDSCESIEVLSAGENIALLNAQIAEFAPKIVVIKNRADISRVKGAKRVLCGESGIIEALNLAESKLVINALVGFAGVLPSLAALNLNKTLALANKESLVVAGFLIPREKLARIIPIDSEHFALKELLESRACVENLIITASGGALRDVPLSEIHTQNAQSALNHPNWQMGKKITIDSASMMNKIFEILEARWLFDTTKITAMIERKSAIHALIETKDGNIFANIASNDMKLPISRAILGEDSRESRVVPRFSLANFAVKLENIDIARYPLWKLKDEVLKTPNLGIILNAANDALVAQFLANKIPFGAISERVFEILNRFESAAKNAKNFEEISAIHAQITRFLAEF